MDFKKEVTKCVAILIVAIISMIPLILSAPSAQSNGNGKNTSTALPGAYNITIATTNELPTTEQITTAEETTTEEPTTEIKYLCQWASFELTKQEFELLCTTVFCEAGNQSLNTQYMVALTVLNRVVAKEYPNTVSGVIYQRDGKGTPQYSVINWSNFEQRGWTKQVEKAVELALYENHHPADMYYFRTHKYHSFGVPYESSDDLYFSVKQ